MIQLRAYQSKAIEEAFAAWYECQNILLVMATGTGKTATATSLITKVVAKSGKKVLFIAHRSELIEQGARSLERGGLNPGIEMADRTTLNKLFAYDSVVASVQTLAQDKRLSEFNPKDFALLVIDEAHHATSATYRKIVDYFAGVKLLGLTATPYRADKVGLKNVFERVAFDYPILTGIKEGYLCPIESRQVTVENLKLESIKVKLGEFSESEMTEMLMIEENLQGMVVPTIELAENRPTIVFCTNIAHAEAVTECFNRISEKVVAVCVHGKLNDADRRSVLNRYESGRAQFIINVGVLTEGYDHPPTACVALFRPMKSLGLLAQCLDMETEVLTKDGFKQNVKEGELVAGWNYKTGMVEWTPALSVVMRKVDLSEKWCSIEAPSVSIRVTDGHRMFYDHKRKTGWKETTAKHLAMLRSGARLPVCGVINKPDLDLTDDEIRFIGWLITDGSVSWKSRTAYICQGEHQPYCEEIDRVMISCGFRYTKTARWRNTQFNQTSRQVKWSVSRGEPRKKTHRHLKGWGYLAKWLENDSELLFQEISERQLDVLLETMHFADGSKQNGQSWTRRSYHIHEHPSLIEKIQVCAVIRGWRSSVAKVSENLSTIHLKKQDFVNCGSTHDGRPVWAISTPNTTDWCWCVENALGTLITRRRGKVVITGNCVGRGTRLAAGKDNCLILDFVGANQSVSTVNCLDVLDGTIIDDQTKKKAQKLADEGVDAVEALEQAKSWVAELQQAKVRMNVSYSKTATGLLELFTLPSARGLYGGAKATPEQINRIRKFDKNISVDGLERGEAQQLLNGFFGRIKEEKATVNQARLLAKHGYTDAWDVSFKEAGDRISKLAENGWQRV